MEYIYIEVFLKVNEKQEVSRCEHLWGGPQVAKLVQRNRNFGEDVPSFSINQPVRKISRLLSFED